MFYYILYSPTFALQAEATSTISPSVWYCSLCYPIELRQAKAGGDSSMRQQPATKKGSVSEFVAGVKENCTGWGRKGRRLCVRNIRAQRRGASTAGSMLASSGRTQAEARVGFVEGVGREGASKSLPGRPAPDESTLRRPQILGSYGMSSY